ncbi:hypothetical protein PAMP_011420 [Pampus punctatissimus]
MLGSRQEHQMLTSRELCLFQKLLQQQEVKADAGDDRAVLERSDGLQRTSRPSYICLMLSNKYMCFHSSATSLIPGFTYWHFSADQNAPAQNIIETYSYWFKNKGEQHVQTSDWSASASITLPPVSPCKSSDRCGTEKENIAGIEEDDSCPSSF